MQCRPDEEIEEFFSNQYIFHWSNKIRFDFKKYGRDSIKQESEMQLSFLGAWRSRQVYEVSTTELALQDLAINIDEITELQDSSVFELKPTITVPYPLEKDLV